MLTRASTVRLACILLVGFEALPAAASSTSPGARTADAVYGQQVLRYEPGFSGGCIPTNSNFLDPTAALGPPDYTGGPSGLGAVSLGSGGLIEIYMSPPISNSGDTRNDLRILEVGGFDEALFVALRPAPPLTHLDMLALGLDDDNGDGFYEIKRVGGGSSYVDLDRSFAIAAQPQSVLFDAIQIIDDADDHSACTSTPGGDIDYVEGMHPFVNVNPGTWTQVKTLYRD